MLSCSLVCSVHSVASGLVVINEKCLNLVLEVSRPNMILQLSLTGSLQVKDSAKGILFYPYKVTEQFTAACSLSEVKLFLSPFLSPNGTVVDAYVAEKLFNFSLINEGDVSKIISSRRAWDTKNVDLSEYSTAVYVTNQLLSKLTL